MPHSLVDPLEQAIQTGQLSLALENVRALCLSTDDATDEQQFRRAADLIQQAGWLREAEPVLQAALSEPEVHPATGVLWSRVKAGLTDWNSYRDLRGLLEQGEIGERAVIEWVDQLVSARNRYELLRAISVGEHWLGDNPVSWGAIASGLRRLQLYRQGHFWVVYWRERERVTAEDLLSVAEIIRGDGYFAEGASANQAAIARFPASSVHAVHQCWLAADAVLADDFDAAERSLQRIDPSEFSGADRFLHTLVTASVSVGRSESARRPDAVSDAMRSIDDARKNCPELRREFARVKVYRHVLEQLAECGGATTRCWCWWRGRRL